MSQSQAENWRILREVKSLTYRVNFVTGNNIGFLATVQKFPNNKNPKNKQTSISNIQ